MNKGLLIATILLALFVLFLLFALCLAYRKFKEYREQVNGLSTELLINERKSAVALKLLEKEKGTLENEVVKLQNEILSISSDLKRSEQKRVRAERSIDEVLSDHKKMYEAYAAVRTSSALRILSKSILSAVSDTGSGDPVEKMKNMCLMMTESVLTCSKKLIECHSAKARGEVVKDLKSKIQIFNNEIVLLSKQAMEGLEEEFFSTEEDIPDSEVVSTSVTGCKDVDNRKAA